MENRALGGSPSLPLLGPRPTHTTAALSYAPPSRRRTCMAGSPPRRETGDITSGAAEEGGLDVRLAVPLSFHGLSVHPQSHPPCIGSTLHMFAFLGLFSF
eukprot:688622-Prymnesium_polylepis.1